jgi:beta-1,4-mannooligosaccharide/beta-1,4-mannosyl-N-acetylglucosamine phosphorylase
MILRRHSANPILSRDSISGVQKPFHDLSSVFNPGAIRVDDRDVLILRLQNRGRETGLLVAESKDGIHFETADRVIQFDGMDALDERVFHLYDPRITKIGSEYFILMAMDMEVGCRLGLAKTHDFKTFQFLGIVSEGDNRNGVLFPEKIDGRYARLDRPNEQQVTDGPKSGTTICLSLSDDLIHWTTAASVAGGRFHYWDELIGPGPPPVKTRGGWLVMYHGIALHYQPIYQVGVMMLDLQNPAEVLARGRYNIFEPRELYEMVGQVPNVVFPSGLIVDDVDSEGYALPGSNLRLYYGAADTCVGLATASLEALIAACQ